MKKVIVAAVLLGLLASAFVFAACGGNSVPAGAIASVGDATVTQEQFDQIWKQAETQYASQPGAPPFPKEGTAQYDQLKVSIIDYLVQNEVIKQQAAEMKVTVTQKQLDERVKQVTDQVGGQKKLDDLLKKQGVSLEQLNSQLESQMLQEAVRTKVGENTKVTEAQIKAYFDDPKNESQFIVADSVDARHVLLDAKNKAEALKVQKLLAADPSDANWAKVAKKYSIDPGTKDKGGSLGSFPKGRMVPEFDKVAFSIKQGVISAPVKSQFGWHVIEVTKITPAKKSTLADSTKQIRQTLLTTAQQTLWAKWLKQAQKNANVQYAEGYDPKVLAKAKATAKPTKSSSPATSPSATGSPESTPSPSPSE